MRPHVLSALVCCVAAAVAQSTDPKACAACHQQIAASYARTGMARSFGTIGSGDPISKATGVIFRHDASEEFFSTVIRDSKTYLVRSQKGPGAVAGNLREEQVVYRIGSGNHARGYLARDRSGDLVELPITWYSENEGYWSMSPGYDRPDHAGFSRKVTFRCLFCHDAYPEIGADATKLPARLPEGIDCERCHGPGRNHIQAVQSGASLDAVRRAIVNPARLDPVRRMEVCLQCHLETTNLPLPASLVRYGRSVFSYRPGEPLEDYILHFDHSPGTGHDEKFEFSSAPYRLRKSACFRFSQGALTCTTCHDPHDIPRGTAASPYYSQICRNCHGAPLAERSRQGRHPASDECASCHMPKRRPSDAIHVTVTDHYIRRVPQAADDLVERNDGNTPPYRGPVVLYYPETLPQTSENELYLAVAQVKNQSNLRQGIPRLEAAIVRSSQTPVEFYSGLAEAYRTAGELKKAVSVFQKACGLAPQDWRPAYGMGMALAASGNMERSAEALRQAVALGPQQATPLHGLAKLFLAQGNLQEAVSTLRKASALEPDSTEIHNDLGIAQLRLGNADAAEKEMREALRLRPEVAVIQINLAELLSRRGRFTEAQFHFERAIRLDGNLAEAHSAYATALAATEHLVEARAQFEAALRIDPRLAVTRNNLGVLLFKLGDTDGAIREYRRALAVRPDYPEARDNLAVALASRGRH